MPGTCPRHYIRHPVKSWWGYSICCLNTWSGCSRLYSSSINFLPVKFRKGEPGDGAPAARLLGGFLGDSVLSGCCGTACSWCTVGIGRCDDEGIFLQLIRPRRSCALSAGSALNVFCWFMESRFWVTERKVVEVIHSGPDLLRPNLSGLKMEYSGIAARVYWCFKCISSSRWTVGSGPMIKTLVFDFWWCSADDWDCLFLRNHY